MNVALKTHASCSPAELKAFRDLVVQGDEVDPNGLEQRIENAKALLFGISDELLVAVAAVKCPDSDYRARHP